MTCQNILPMPDVCVYSTVKPPSRLGRLADPPMTKDAVVGRIRRLLSMADKRAEELQIPDTNDSVTEDLFDQS